MVEDKHRREIWSFLEERFGISPDIGDRFLLWQRGRTYWILADETLFVQEMAALRVVSVGLPLVRRVLRGLKPTSAGLRLLSPWIRRNRIRLTDVQIRELLTKGEISWTADHSVGHVLLETDAGALGCGFMLKGKLLSQIPKADVAALNLAP